MKTRSLASCVVLAMFVVGAPACGGAPNPPANDQTTVTVSPPSGSTPPAAPAAPPAAK
jgi:hypothetical protein